MTIGDLVYIKTTGEPVMLVRVPEGRTDVFIARRPRDTKNDGVLHEEEMWYSFELETHAERLTRNYEEFLATEELRKKLDGKEKVDTPEVVN